jgi:hypothetical protein
MGIEIPLFEYAALGSLYFILREDLAAGRSEKSLDSLRWLKRVNTLKVVVCGVLVGITALLTTTLQPAYWLCDKGLNLHYTTAGYNFEGHLDYPLTFEEEESRSFYGLMTQMCFLTVTVVRLGIWVFFFQQVWKIKRLVPSDSKTSNVIALTRSVVRVGFIPFVLELVGSICAVAALLLQSNIDKEKDQIVNCIFCFQLWMLLSFRRFWFIRSICTTGVRDAAEGLRRYAELYDTAGLAALLEYHEEGERCLNRLKGAERRMTIADMMKDGLATCKGVRLSQLQPNAFQPGDTTAEFAGAAAEAGTEPEPIQCDDPDFFVSHSWQDSFSEKYEALQKVSRAFELQNGREPILWIDKYCIDQKNIKQSLKYLPVYVNACKKRLVIHGPSYFSRLWCMWELYVMKKGDPTLDNTIFMSVENHGTDALGVELSTFDLANAGSYNRDDKAKVISIINSQRGGVAGFNSTVREMPKQLSLFQRSVAGAKSFSRRTSQAFRSPGKYAVTVMVDPQNEEVVR